MGKSAPLSFGGFVDRVVWALVVSWIFLPEFGICQSAQDRYQLGRRLERFERAWQGADPESRARSTASMEQAVGSFFSLQLGRAGKFLDQGWLQVTGVEESEQVERFAGLGWKLEFERTLLDVKDPVVRGRASVFYDSASANEGTDGLGKRHEVVLSLWPWSDNGAKGSASEATAGESHFCEGVSLWSWASRLNWIWGGLPRGIT